MKPQCDPVSGVNFHLTGEIGRRLSAVTDQWILPAPFANPAILEMFRDRDRKPARNVMPWAGEFAGKYLTHAVQVYRLTRDEKLINQLRWFVAELVSLQAEDGYLGPWSKDFRLTGRAFVGSGNTWDAWGHYHIMLGLLLWYRETKDQPALTCARRIADLLCKKFLNTGLRLVSTGAEEMNLAPIHALCLLYKETGEQKYLDLAHEIEKDFETPPAGDYVRTALARKEFYQTPKPRWESLHPIMGIAELYYITGDEKYRRAFEHIWWSIARYDRHNNGGFSSGEQASGNPYHEGAIETCCTIAWLALSVEMLRLTGNSVVADEIELSTLNSGLGLISPSGRWVTYDTPMEGCRTASQHTIVFQARPGQPELNCCSVNGPRALGLISEWALMADDQGILVNYYGPGKMSAALPSGNTLTLTQDTEYPIENQIRLSVQVDRPEIFSLALRIPYWSEKTSVRLNGTAVSDIRPGQYLRLNRLWSSGDEITVDLDFRFHFWINEDKVLTRDWVTQWKVFGPIAVQTRTERDLETLLGDYLTQMPNSLTVDNKALSPIVIGSEGGRINFIEHFKRSAGLSIACCYTEIESEADQPLPVYFGADWFVAWFVNGRKIFDNHPAGGNNAPADQRLHLVKLPLRKGKNLVCVRVTAGTDGWNLTLGRRFESADIPESTKNISFASIYRGPILLAFDPRFNDIDPLFSRDLPTLNALGLTAKRVEPDTWLKPWKLFEFITAEGKPFRLCDFAGAGAAGNPYLTWFPIRFSNPPKMEFSPQNPLRSFRPRLQ